LWFAGLAAIALTLTPIQPVSRANAQETSAAADQDLQGYYQNNLRAVAKLVFSRMLKQLDAYPSLEDNNSILVISSLIPALERRVPDFCRFETKEEREKFFSLPQQMLMTREQFSLFAEETCQARLLFLKNRDFIYVALRADAQTPKRERFGKNVIVEVIADADDHEDFISRANQLAIDLNASGAPED